MPVFHPFLGDYEEPFLPPVLGMKEMFTHGNVPPGFYVASGSYDLISRVSEKLVDLIERESRLEMGGLSSRSRLSIGRLFWIDSGNLFDPYYVSQQAAKRGLDPHRVLRSIQIARPFTAFQFQRMLSEVPAGRSLSVESGSSSVPGQKPVHRIGLAPLVVISDLMALFYDEEARYEDVQRAFKDFLVGLYPLRQRAVVLGLLLHRAAPPRRGHFLPQVLKLAKGMVATRSSVFAGDRGYGTPEKTTLRFDVTQPVSESSAASADRRAESEVSLACAEQPVGLKAFFNASSRGGDFIFPGKKGT
ncbi:MAG: hypothetical protein LHV69_11020 [Elusimicrobia bacterium]|nr:hypothetical protein [Candidatus Obscuribacterium magneticum]